MAWITSNIQWIMIVSGVLTFSMVYAAIVPRAALNAFLGECVEGPAAGIVVRNWGALIALIGAMLIYGAFDPPSRPLILVVACASKLIFIGLVIACGTQTSRRKAGPALVIDATMIVLFAWFLLAAIG